MASVTFAQNSYAGEVLEDLLTYKIGRAHV